jgi:uridine kinase
VFPVEVRQAAHDVRTDLTVSAPAVTIDSNSVLLFEGIFLFRSQLELYWDFRILLYIDAATSLSRAVERDSRESPEEVLRRKYKLRYDPAWQIYIDRDDPEAKADVIIDNRDFRNPEIRFHGLQS